MLDPYRHASRALTVSAELLPDGDRAAALERTLATIARDLGGNPILRPCDLPDTHFTRWVIVDDATAPAADRLPPLLLWESNHDGDPEDYLRKVQAAALGGAAVLDVDAVFGACVDYPGVAAGEAWLGWMGAHSIRAEAFYAGYRGVSKDRVDAARRVHAEIRRFLDQGRAALDELSPPQLHRHIRNHLQVEPPPALMRPGDLAPIVRRGALFAVRKYVTYTLIALGALLLLTVFLPVTLAAYLLLRHHERRDRPDVYDRPVHGDPDLIAVEDRIVQNQFTHLVDVKPGLFRYVLLRTVLFVIDQVAGVYAVHGKLNGITSIHFARWVMLHDRRPARDVPGRRRHRLLFFASYDFSWESYLGEFVDRSAGWLTAVWSNTAGFPRTYRLVDEGADDEEAFKQWTRDHQIPTQVWWSGVRDATVENLNTDVEIHRGLAGPLDGEEAARWVRRL